jgi:predicted extracellular nuclease
MKKAILFFIILLLFISGFTGKGQARGDIRVMFYNTENFFDTEDDPATVDEDFTPSGKQHWTTKRYGVKLNHLYQAIAAVGTWQPPEIIGLCEVENRRVLSDLIYQTPLSKYKYQIIQFDSPDPRGIEVTLLYRADKVKLLKQYPIPVYFIDNPQKKTRDILFAELLLNDADTVCFFVNHWPSRRGGEMESESSRVTVASMLRQSIDSLFRTNPMMKLIVMGDFNDEPTNVSITQTLKTTNKVSQPYENQLFNLSYHLMQSSKTGTHYFQGQWQIIDQMIVSGGLLSCQRGFTTSPDHVHICSDSFLLQTDKRNIGNKPYPTYSGPKYIGGYSDHLPIYLDLFSKK